ncbi:MAG: DeoR/GlpR family DNA-binding transcription regulator [Eubacteriales bacterium]|nr:DeoR/GlpR family DNA-binding transcription regulator [Eubacteriales bacterium]
MMNERISKVRDYIQSRGEVSVSELQGLYSGYSSMTIWRDLKQLEEQGYLRRVHGGVITMQASTLQVEGVYSKRARENTRQKIAIAKAAVRFILPGHAVYLDAGSTLMAVANHLGSERYTIITSGANIAIELSQRHTCDVLLTGGQISENTLSCSGSQAEHFISTINIDLALLSPSGFSQKNGFTSGSQSESMLKRAVLSKASKVVMLMDTSKIGRSLPFTFAALSDIDTIICDAALPPDLAADAKAQGVECIVAES